MTTSPKLLAFAFVLPAGVSAQADPVMFEPEQIIAWPTVEFQGMTD